MSLINKMLQDLEERDPEAAGNDLLHPSIRPAPARRKIHPAWFIAAASTAAFLLALGGFSWHRMRSRIAEIPLIVQQAQLPLKMADRLSIPASQPEMNPVRPAPAQEIAVGSAEVRSQVPNPPAQADPGENLMEPVKADDIALKAPSSPPKLSTRLSVEAVSSSKKAENAASEQEREPDRRSASSAASLSRGVPTEAVRPPAVNGTSAIVAAKQMHELSPHEKAENEYRKAGVLIQQGRAAEAAVALEQSLTFDPRHTGARQVLIGLLLEARRTDDAMTKAREGLALDNNQSGLAMILARLQVEKGDLQGAIDTLQHSLPSGAESAEYQAFYAALMQRSGNHKEAIAHYEIALRSMPQNGVWWMGLGISLQAEQRLADARNAFARAKSSGTLSPALMTFVDQRLSQLRP